MVAEALLLLPYQMSAVVNSFLSNELASNRILFESQLPVLGEKGLFACQRTNKGLSHFREQSNVVVSKQEQIFVILERSIRA